MKVSVLSENTSVSPDIVPEHGLSLFLETRGRNILFDTGASCQYKDNAAKMGVDIGKADMAVISHGHYDHGGGLCGFLNFNEKADVYISPYAFGDFRARLDGKENYIGLDIKFAFHPRLRPVYIKEQVDENVMIFSAVKGDWPRPSGNDCLFVYSDGTYVPDDFCHEQNLVVQEGDGYVLVAGCAHSGIVNIVEHSRQLMGGYPKAVIGGFHLWSHGTQEREEPAAIARLAEKLVSTGAQYFTGHCTGTEAYQQLRELMGQRVAYLAAGSQFEIT